MKYATRIRPRHYSAQSHKVYLDDPLAGSLHHPAPARSDRGFGTIWHDHVELQELLFHPDNRRLCLEQERVHNPASYGSALGLSGAALQGMTRNPLAEPGLLGVTAGAALGAVIAIYFGLALHDAIAAPVTGLIGALLASGLTFALGSGGGTIALVLAGAAVSSLAAARTGSPDLFEWIGSRRTQSELIGACKVGECALNVEIKHCRLSPGRNSR